MIVLELGAMGSGKTLSLVKEAYAGYKQGKKVYANFKLNFPFSYLDYEDIVNCNLENCIVIIDEAPLWGLDSRSSMSKNNKEITSRFIVMCRKKDVDLFLTAQIQRQIDARVRENATYYVFNEKYIKKNGVWIPAVEGTDSPRDTPVVIFQENVNIGSEKVRKTWFYGNPYFDLYDTKEVIRSQYG